MLLQTKKMRPTDWQAGAKFNLKKGPCFTRKKTSSRVIKRI